MKIKATQLDGPTRDRIARTLNCWAKRYEKFMPILSNRYRQIAIRIKHGDLILCEYVYPEQEEGGEHEI